MKFETKQDSGVRKWNEKQQNRFKMHIQLLDEALKVVPRPSKDFFTLKSIEDHAISVHSITDAQAGLVSRIYTKYVLGV